MPGGGPIGNQKGKLPPNRGRPPTFATNEEIIELGKEMVEWLLNKRKNKEHVWHLSEFYVIEKDLSRSEWHTIRQRVEFKIYYERALELMTLFTLQNKDLSTAYGSRFIGMYSQDLREHEREEFRQKAEVEAAAKAKEVANITDKEKEQNEAIVRGVIAMQEALKSTR